MKLNAITGINSNKTNDQISIYPNPSSGHVNVTVKENGVLHIYNSFGEEIKKQNLTEGENAIDISAAASGIYFVEVKRENSVWRGKLIKD